MNIISEKDFRLNGYRIENTKDIVSLSEYLDFILYIQNEWKQKELWYRGVPDKNFKLIPNIYRDSTWNYDNMNAYNIFNHFIRSAKQYLTPGKNISIMEWYQMQQHYGLPTRLLDWSEGYLIALYFAVRNIKDNKSPSVWVLEPFVLNQRSSDKSSIFFSDETIMDKNDSIVSEYLYDNDKLPYLPISIYPTHIDQRFKSQKSCFTIHGEAFDGFEQTYFQDRNKFKLAQLNISNSKAEEIKQELNLAGVSESTLFPDLEGLARELKHQFGMN